MTLEESLSNFLLVDYGSALSLAAETKFVIWCEDAEGELFHDCSLILLAEVNRFAFEQTGYWGWAQDIDCAIWQALYTAARYPRIKRRDRRAFLDFMGQPRCPGLPVEPAYYLVYWELYAMD